MVTEIEDSAMSQGRGLLTESEREAIAGNASDSYRYKTRSFFRDRLDKLADDIAVLEEHDSELLDELREIVCEDVEDRDIAEFGSSEDLIEPVEEGDRSDIEAKEEIYDDVDEQPSADVSTLVTTEDVTSSGKEAEARRDAAVAVLALLQEYGEADTASLKDAAWDAYLNAHDVETVDALEEVPLDTYASASEPVRNLWNNNILRVLGETDHVEKRSDAERSGGYRWVDDD